MSSRNSAANSQVNAPFALNRRRTIMACSNCRKRKIRCMTPEQPPVNPCARCVKRNLHCEYVAAPEPEYYSNSGNADFPTQDLPDAGPTRSRTPAPPTWTQPAPAPSHHQGFNPAPPLPYTGPPMNRPRYSGSTYPSLALHEPSQQYMDPRAHAQHSNYPANFYQSQGYDMQSGHGRQYSSSHAPGPSQGPTMSTQYPPGQYPGQYNVAAPQHQFNSQDGSSYPHTNNNSQNN
ncbi:hypothetical protein C8R43DRAFT_1230310 [Mycena crocata]|nr:hypothetical protein C8R43DRAFT_1230310 [Mycena crocata]